MELLCGFSKVCATLQTIMCLSEFEIRVGEGRVGQDGWQAMIFVQLTPLGVGWVTSNDIYPHSSQIFPTKVVQKIKGQSFEDLPLPFHIIVCLLLVDCARHWSLVSSLFKSEDNYQFVASGLFGCLPRILIKMNTHNAPFRPCGNVEFERRLFVNTFYAVLMADSCFVLPKQVESCVFVFFVCHSSEEKKTYVAFLSTHYVYWSIRLPEVFV